MIVLKFGGTSVQDANAMEKVLSILKLRKNEPQVVVLSACSEVTDTLIEIVRHSRKGEVDLSLELAHQIYDRHISIAKALINDEHKLQEAILDLDSLFQKLNELIDGIAILKECTTSTNAKCISFGEYLSTTLFYHYCKTEMPNCKLLDSKDLIKISDKPPHSVVDYKKTNKLINDHIDHKPGITLVQGFIASNSNGKITTFTRGGSDFSASIIGAALQSDSIEIWSDVNGVLSADPLLVPNAKTIDKMSFDMMSELSFYGAKVLHPEAIKPAMEQNIPVVILNTFYQKHQGTTILAKTKETCKINTLILNSNCPVLTNTTKTLSTEEIKGITNFITTNNKIVLFSSVSDNKVFILLNNKTEKDELARIKSNHNIKMELHDIVILSGNGISIKPELLEALQQTTNCKLKGIFCGHSKYSIIAVYSRGYGISALKQLHKQLIETEK